MKDIVIIGSGNLAESLCKWINQSGNNLLQIYSRNQSRAEFLASSNHTIFCTDKSQIKKADIYIISVTDGAIKEISEKIVFGNSIVLHTSGACGIEELSYDIENKGVLYPLQTFTGGRELNFRKIPLFIEANNNYSYRIINDLAHDISDTVFDSDTEMRRMLHIGAVFFKQFH